MLAEVLRRFGADYLAAHELSAAQAKAWRAIVACRTPALGGHHLRCDACGAEPLAFVPQPALPAMPEPRARRVAAGAARRAARRSHALMACGGLDADAEGRWTRPKRAPNFLFPVHALSRVFRGKFLQALGAASDAGALPRDPARTSGARRDRLRAAPQGVGRLREDAAGRAGGGARLSGALHAPGCERILRIEGDKVRLRVRADANGGKRTVALDGVQFVGRYLQHVLPGGFKRIRHYGLLAPKAKAERLALARRALAMPAANPRAIEDARAFMRRVAAIEIDCCPHCKTGRWVTIEVVAARRGRSPKQRAA